MLAERVKEWTREWKEQGIQQGIQQGVQQGIQQGVQSGFSEMVLRLLNKKFGPISPEVESRIKQADRDQLLLWSERILSAESVEEVLEQ